MFKSIKSKLIGITLVIFAIFTFIILDIEKFEYDNFKKTQEKTYKTNIENSAKILESTISQLENNVRFLALSSASFYFYNKNKPEILDFITKDNFMNGKLHAIGGGIWFEPYIINKNSKRFCSYASWNGDSVVNDKNCASESYNYLQKHWYTEVKNSYTIENRKTVTWIKPYFDEIGTKNLMITVCAPIYDKNYKFIGMVSEDWLVDSVDNVIETLQPTPNSIVVFADKKNNFIIAVSGVTKDVQGFYVGKSLETLPWYNKNLSEIETIEYDSVKYVVYTKDFANGMQLIVRIPEEELYFIHKKTIYLEVFLPFVSALILSFMIYLILIKNINKPIQILMNATKEIGNGNFDKKISINKPKEFAKLAETFNTMTTDIENHLNNIRNLTNEKMQMLSDLNIAKEIQTSSLPNVFPPFPDRVEIDLYASMKTAKEVGGDFYDFYFIDATHVVFTIADVSGKGVPAALFMMRAKSALKSTALSNHVIETVMEKVNSEIGANNDKNFFVTIGFGVIDITTGEIVYINAGHNPPILKTKDEVKYLTVPSNIVVGIFDDIRFEAIKFNLNPLETLFLYTDGVTEAIGSDGDFYGEDYLREG